MATPFQERSPCHTASYPNLRSACAGKAAGSALSSCRLTTSGLVLPSQANRLSSRLLMLLMLKVATFTRELFADFPFLASDRTLPWQLEGRLVLPSTSCGNLSLNAKYLAPGRFQRRRSARSRCVRSRRLRIWDLRFNGCTAM